jgi:hypothetical protein
MAPLTVQQLTERYKDAAFWAQEKEAEDAGEEPYFTFWSNICVPWSLRGGMARPAPDVFR